MFCSLPDLLLEASVLHREYQSVIDEYSSPKEGSQALHFETQYALGIAGQYKLLTWRYMQTYWRLTEYNAVR